jgi:hypothetical protein
VLPDHNFLTNIDGLNATHGADEKFLVVRGEEVTARAGDKSDASVNGLDINEPGSRAYNRTNPSAWDGCAAQHRTAFRAAFRCTRTSTHPNFGWSIDHGRICSRARNYKDLVEDQQRPSRAVNQSPAGGGVSGVAPTRKKR